MEVEIKRLMLMIFSVTLTLLCFGAIVIRFVREMNFTMSVDINNLIRQNNIMIRSSQIIERYLDGRPILTKEHYKQYKDRKRKLFNFNNAVTIGIVNYKLILLLGPLIYMDILANGCKSIICYIGICIVGFSFAIGLPYRRYLKYVKNENYLISYIRVRSTSELFKVTVPLCKYSYVILYYVFIKATLMSICLICSFTIVEVMVSLLNVLSQ